jgi:hypothetical protein
MTEDVPYKTKEQITNISTNIGMAIIDVLQKEAPIMSDDAVISIANGFFMCLKTAPLQSENSHLKAGVRCILYLMELEFGKEWNDEWNMEY